MRLVGTLSQSKDADRFSDYLLTLGITIRVEPRQNQWDVWVREEDKVQLARSEFEEFQQNPQGEKYAQAISHARKLRIESAKRDAAVQKNVVEMRRQWGNPGSGMSFALRKFTLFMIVACFFVGISTNFGSRADNDENSDRIINNLQISRERGALVQVPYLKRLERLVEVRHGQWWRLFTPCLLHFGLVHLIMNVVFAARYMAMVESNLRTWKTALLVVVLAVVSNLVQFMASGPNFGGLSGVNFGVFGFAWMRSVRSPDSSYSVSPIDAMFTLIFFLVCMTGKAGPIANYAHGAGLGLGILLGMIAPMIRRHA